MVVAPPQVGYGGHSAALGAVPFHALPLPDADAHSHPRRGQGNAAAALFSVLGDRFAVRVSPSLAIHALVAAQVRSRRF